MPHRFEPFGSQDGEPEPRKHPDRPSTADILRMAVAAGMMPEGSQIIYEDEYHVVVAARVSVGDAAPGSDSTGSWEPGTPLPHTTFSDPPFASTSAEYRENLVRAVRRAEDRDDFVLALKAQLGADMVSSHDVPVDVAMDGCEEFGNRLYEEFRDAHPE